MNYFVGACLVGFIEYWRLKTGLLPCLRIKLYPPSGIVHGSRGFRFKLASIWGFTSSRIPGSSFSNLILAREMNLKGMFVSPIPNCARMSLPRMHGVSSGRRSMSRCTLRFVVPHVRSMGDSVHLRRTFESFSAICRKPSLVSYATSSLRMEIVAPVSTRAIICMPSSVIGVTKGLSLDSFLTISTLSGSLGMIVLGEGGEEGAAPGGE